MSKYDPLYDHLLFSGRDKVTMTFEQIEGVLGQPLPPSARQHDEWWANNPTGHTQAKAWHMASYKTEGVKVGSGSITFALDIPAPAGLMESSQMPLGAPPNPKSTAVPAPGSGQHPLFGSMKGTTIVAPGYDLTAPTYLLLDEPDASS